MGILKLLFIENQPLLIFLQILKVFLPTLILQNGYPKFFIGRCVKTFLGKMISPPPKVQTPTVSKLLIPIVLPYTGNHAIQIR
jgi:hypothetical protein